MNPTPENLSPKWTKKYPLYFAIATTALGTGFLWKFPFSVYDNGGTIYIFLYLIFLTFIGLPLMTSEMMIGRGSQCNLIDSYSKLGRSLWKFIGWFNLLTLISLLACFCITGGWMVTYFFNSFSNLFSENTLPKYNDLLNNTFVQGLGLSVFMILSTSIVFICYKGKMEKIFKLLFISGAILLSVVMIYCLSLYNSHFSNTLGLMFSFTTSKISSRSFLLIFEQSLLIVGIGLGVYQTYSSFIISDRGLSTTSIRAIGWVSLLFSISCFCVIPILFTFENTGGEFTFGYSWLFDSVPALFMEFPAGKMMIFILFLTLLIFSLLSSIGFLFPLVSVLTQKLNFSNFKACLLIFGLIWLLGILTLFSKDIDFSSFNQTTIDRKTIITETLKTDFNLNDWEQIRLSVMDGIFNQSYFEKNKISSEVQNQFHFTANEYTSSITIINEIPGNIKGLQGLLEYFVLQWMIPLGLFLYSVFVGWILPESFKRAEFAKFDPYYSKFYNIWNVLIKYFVPMILVIVIIYR